MKLLYQLLIIFSICLCSEFVSSLFPFPFPASVLSLFLLFLLLLSKCLKTDHIKEVSEFLLHNMAFFFIPAGVGILEQFSALRSCWFPFLLICLCSTFLTFATTAFTVSFVIKIMNRKGGSSSNE